MRISQLYTYPIKSLRPTPLSNAVLTEQGFPYDRRFMLLKVEQERGGRGEGGGGEEGNAETGTESETQTERTTLKNMHVCDFPEMSLFLTDLLLPSSQYQHGNGPSNNEDDGGGRVIVTYSPPRSSSSSSSSSPKPTSQQRQDDTTTTTNTNMNNDNTKTLQIPLTPNTDDLKELQIVMHNSPTKAYNMGPVYNDWFSERFGYRVVLAYLGGHSRPVLGNFSPSSRLREATSASTSSSSPSSSSSSWLSRTGRALSSWVWGGGGGSSNSNTNGTENDDNNQGKITFADCAPYLIVSETSVHDVSARLQQPQPQPQPHADHDNNDTPREEMDITKFRPNIVISGAPTPYEEDFWSELSILDNNNHKPTPTPSMPETTTTTHPPENPKPKSKTTLLLTANCVRCRSLNVDYNTGNYGTGPSGSVLKKLMKDRRVDRGARFSPVFGRYGFLGGCGGGNGGNGGGDIVRVGDGVVVSRVAGERSVNYWPF